MRKLMFLIVAVLITSFVMADGLIIPERPDSGGRFIMNYHNVSITIENGVAIVKIVEEFQNISEFRSEAIYLFPVPSGAVINDFVMKTGDQVLKGEVLPADEARNIYQDIVARLKDPALLEYVGNSLVKLSVFPFEAGEKREITVTYVQPLEVSGNSYAMTYPLKIEENLAGPIGAISIRVKSSDPYFADLFSPTHDFDSIESSDGKEYIFMAKDYKPYSDVVILLTSSRDEISSSLVYTWNKAREEGYFMLTLIPKLEETNVIPKDLVFVLDISGSMYGDKIDQAKKALVQVLQLLRENDRFSIIIFDDRVTNFTGGLVDAGRKEQWIKKVKEIQADGSTNIHAALKEGIEIFGDKSNLRFKTILFLTDGEPTSGITDIGTIVNDSTLAARKNDIHIFAFGVGMGVNAELLDRLVQENAGKVSYIAEGETIEGKVTELYRSIETPALEKVSIVFEGIKPIHIAPEGVFTLFAGNALRLFGLYYDSGEIGVNLNGIRGGKEYEYNYSFVLSKNMEHSFIEVLWAQKRVAELANRYRYDLKLQAAEKEEIKQEIIALSKRYNIINEFTSFLIGPEFVIMDNEVLDYSAQPQQTGRVLAAKSVAEMAEDRIGGISDQDFVFVEGERFVMDETGIWIQDVPDIEDLRAIRIKAFSPAYFYLLEKSEWITKVALLGSGVKFVYEEILYEIGEDGLELIEELETVK